MNTNAGPPNLTEFTRNDKINNATTFLVLSLLQIITGSLFNGFVISLLLVNQRLREIPANVILLSLAISDFFACAVVLPYHVYLVLHVYENRMHLTLLLFSMTVSMIGTVVLTADRFLAIVYPLRYNVLVTIRRTRYVLVSYWLLSILYATIFYIALCYQIKGMRYFLLLVEFCAVLTILVFYGVIFRAAFRQIRQIKYQDGDVRGAGVAVFKRTLSSAKTSGSIVFFFVVSYLPVFILAACNEYRSVPISTYNDYIIWLLCLAFLNCNINPLLYCMFSEKLRHIILGHWRRMVVCHRTHGVPTQSDMIDANGPL